MPCGSGVMRFATRDRTIQILLKPFKNSQSTKSRAVRGSTLRRHLMDFKRFGRGGGLLETGPHFPLRLARHAHALARYARA